MDINILGFTIHSLTLKKNFPKIEELLTSLYEKVNENPFLSKSDFQQAKIKLEGKYKYDKF